MLKTYNKRLMKKLLTLMICLCIGGVISAQQDSTDVIGTMKAETDLKVVKIETDSEFKRDGSQTDTTRIQFGNKFITIITKGADDEDVEVTVTKKSRGEKAELTWWNGIDLGLNSFMDANYNFGLEGEFDFLNPRTLQSRYISANFAAVKLRLIGDYVGITTGMTIQIYNFKYGGSNIFALGDSLYAFPSGDINLNKNKLRAEYFGIPLLMEFNTSLDPSRSFHITAGVVGKVRMGNMYKIRGEIDDDRFKDTFKGELGLNRWALDGVLRVGYGRFTVFGQVGLLPMFSSNNAPDIYTFAAGFAINLNDMD